MNSKISYTGPHGYKYQLALTYEHEFITPVPEDMPDLGRINDYIHLDAPFEKITLAKGYAWDGATMATDAERFMRASLVHDALYQIMAAGILSWRFKRFADVEMRKIAIEDGFARWRAWARYRAVRQFGGQRV